MKEDIKGEEMDDGSSDSSEIKETRKKVIYTQNELNYLEQLSDNNQFVWTHQINYINALRDMDEKEKLNKARETLAKNFPLPEENWLEWIRDLQGEDVSQLSEDTREYILGLYERSLNDFISIEIWLEYGVFAQMMASFFPESGFTYDKVREIYERGLSKVGLHFTEGDNLWNAYIEFEHFLNEFYSNAKDEYKVEEQSKRVKNLLMRKLKVPLSDHEKTFQTFVDLYGKEEIKADYSKMLKELDVILPFENKINNKEDTQQLYKNMVDYIKFETKKNKNPARCQFLFERAIKAFPSDVALWGMYLNYLEKHFNTIPDLIISNYKRSVRNIYWSGSTWNKYLLVMERFSISEEEILQVFEFSIQAGLSTPGDFLLVFQFMFDYYRRGEKSQKINDAKKKLVEVFNRGKKFFKQYFPKQKEYSALICKEEAKYALMVDNNTVKFHNLWEKRILNAIPKDEETWVEYITLVRYFEKNVEKTRELYENACGKCQHNSYPYKLFDSWKQFEREEGDFESFSKCERRITSYTNVLSQKIEQQMTEIYIEQNEDINKGKKRKDLYENEQINEDNKKRKTEGEDDMEEEKNYDKETQETLHNAQKRTIFINNIAFSVKNEDIEQAFSRFGKIKQNRLIMDQNTGKSKGFAYVEYYEEKDAVKAQIMMDREKIQGRQIIVQMSSSSLGENKAHLHTVYLANIHYDSKEEDISEAFKVCGIEKIKEIRVVKNKTGQSTCAFVEFYSVEDTKKAYTLSGQLKVKDRECFVERARNVKEKKVTDNHQDKATSIKQVNNDDTKTIFVGDIPIDSTEKELFDLFSSSCGEVERVRLAKARKGVSKGRAFIDFKDVSSKEKAINLNGELEIDGEILLIQTPSPPKKDEKKKDFGNKDFNSKNNFNRNNNNTNRPPRRGYNNDRKGRVAVEKKDATPRDSTPKSNDFFKNLLK